MGALDISNPGAYRMAIKLNIGTLELFQKYFFFGGGGGSSHFQRQVRMPVPHPQDKLEHLCNAFCLFQYTNSPRHTHPSLHIKEYIVTISLGCEQSPSPLRQVKNYHPQD